MTQEELDKRVDTLMQRFDDVNNFFIAKVADQIKKIGKLTQSNINRLVIMAEMNRDIAAITTRLQQATRLGIKEMNEIYNQALNDTYTDPRFERVLTHSPMSQEAKDRLQQYARNVSMQTAGTMQNLSNTTAISGTYRQAVDKAVLAVSSGLGDYRSATRQAVRELGYNGMQVQYESGYHRRLDTALRQNIVDGANQIAQNGSILMGEDLGFDAYEISAHARSAPDHEPVQGRVFMKAEFEKMQQGLPFQDINGKQYEGFRRPIGEWNCMHIVMSFSSQYSIPRYTENQLNAWAAENNKGCLIDGKKYTIYQAAQLMRQIETQVRREKDAANVARAVGDDELRKQCQVRINALGRKYSQVVSASGLKSRKERMQVEGFRMVKV